MFSPAEKTGQPVPLPSETTGNSTGGFIFLLAVPSALTSHVTWALENLTAHRLAPTWQSQPLKPGYHRADISWQGNSGGAALIASTLRHFRGSYFEVTERRTATSDALRIMHTPELGICTLPVDLQGNFTVTEDRIRYAFEKAAGNFDELYRQFSAAVGQPWDNELEPLRPNASSASATVRLRA